MSLLNLGSLNAEDDELLSRDNSQQPFRFYSPTKTLQHYLKRALEAEYLYVSDKTVLTWAQQRTSILRDWQLLAKFQIQPDNKTPWLLFDAEGVLQLQNDCDKYVLSATHELVLRTQSGKALNSYSGDTDDEIELLKLYADELLSAKSVEAVLPLLYKLQQDGAPLLAKYQSEYKVARDAAVKPLMGRFRNDEEVWKKLSNFETIATNATDEIDDETFDDADAPQLTAAQSTLKIQRLLNRFIPAYALFCEMPKEEKLSESKRQIEELIRKYLPEEGYPAVAKAGRFLQLFRPLLAGPELILDSWPRVFKVMRGQEFCSERYAEQVNSDPKHPARAYQKASALHHDEIDAMIMGLNRLIRSFYKILPEVYAKSQNKYIIGFRNEVRPIIAVDEASDYSLLQLKVITQLSHPKYDCVTLCGDLMQRMGPYGLQSWDDYMKIFPKTALATLTKSYRQSRTLLGLAARLYEIRMGRKPSYEPSGRVKTPFQLRPVVFKNTDADVRFEWLVSAIVNLRTVLDELIPNLAILVHDKNQAQELAERLTDAPQMHEIGIAAEACEGQAIGEVDIIRIFPVSQIKGMEFDAIILWEADLLAEKNAATQVDKLMYIALSRASFYATVVLAKKWPKELQGVKTRFTIDGWDKQMLDDVEDNEENDVSTDEPVV